METPHQREEAFSVLSKMHRILGAFKDIDRSLGLTELSRRSEVPKSSVHRIATELTRLGYLAKGGDGYQLGSQLFEIGKDAVAPAKLLEVTLPFMVDLLHENRALSVDLAVGHLQECVFIGLATGSREARYLQVAPAGHTGLSAPEKVLRAYGAIHQSTHRSLEDESADRVVRKQRYAVDIGDIAPGFKTYAGPIFSPSTDTVAAVISISVRLEHSSESQLLSGLWRASSFVTQALTK